MLKLIAIIESFDNHFVAWVENTRNIKGMVVEGNSVSEVMQELMTSLKVKIAYDLGIDISSINHRQISSDVELLEFKNLKFMDGRAKKEINLQMSI